MVVSREIFLSPKFGKVPDESKPSFRISLRMTAVDAVKIVDTERDEVVDTVCMIVATSNMIWNLTTFGGSAV